MKNFWNYLTFMEKSLFFISFILLVFVFLIPKQVVLFSMLLAFSINYIVSVFHTFETNKNILIERTGYLRFMVNVYDNTITGGIKKILNNIKRNDEHNIFNHDATISNMDASFLKENLINIKNLINILLQNKSFNWSEKRCLYILKSRITEFLEDNPNIIIYKDGIFGVSDIQINAKWLFDIPFLFEKQKDINFQKETIIKMYSKYVFDKKHYED